ncbi:hypothetical protein [Longimicrobium sp.]|jgi:hypothetical protein|uniref:hypothetical protein n=1 Tax=Longimicrobium sp. TaxID=2029185 RepID=UPI002F92E7C5
MARHLASSLIGMYAGAWDEFAEFKFLTPEEQEQVNEAMRDVESLLDRVRPSDRLDAYIEDARDRWVAGAQSGQREAADA